MGNRITNAIRNVGTQGRNLPPGPPPDTRPENIKALDKYFPTYSPFLENNQLMDVYKVNRPSDISWGGDVGVGQLDTTKLAANRQALNAMTSRALAEGDSPWAKLMLQKSAQEESQAQDRFAQQARSQTAQGMSDLAMRGGLSSGARERMARSGAEQLRAGYQDLGAAGAGRRMDIGIEDEQQKMAMLQNIPGLELGYADQLAGLNRYNIDKQYSADVFNRTGQMQSQMYNRDMEMQANLANQRAALSGGMDRNQFELEKFRQYMGAVAANATADALAAGEGGGGGGGKPWHSSGQTAQRDWERSDVGKTVGMPFETFKRGFRNPTPSIGGRKWL